VLRHVVRPATGWLGAGLRAAVDIAYPPSCIACQAATGEAQALCPTCWGEMRFIERPYCERLGTPFAVDFGGPLLSPAAMADPPAYGRARAVARHDGLARDLVLRLKYGDRLDLARAMGAWMARAGAELLADDPVLVPVPLHPIRLWRRRMNQAALLADAVARADGRTTVVTALARRRATRPQVGLTRPERARNLQGAFAASAQASASIAGRRIVLVDDVVTTGATANAAARVLLRAGAAAVDVLSFSRGCAPP
jgi:ComF family protein